MARLYKKGDRVIVNPREGAEIPTEICEGTVIEDQLPRGKVLILYKNGDKEEPLTVWASSLELLDDEE